jgi:TPP-dependent pyruvate/acetoin dehydrogenase alpha subunit
MNTALEMALFKKLVLCREIEEAIRRDYFNDEMKTPVHLGIGAEAIAAGVTEALGAGAFYFGTYRNHNLYACSVNETDKLFAELFGRATGVAMGKAGSMHLSNPERSLVLTSAVVATTIPVAVGYAFAQRYLGFDKTVAVFFGDGAIEEGVFWETLNYAVLQKLPVLFVCEDNDFAIHTPKNSRQAHRNLSQMIEGAGAIYQSGDGKKVEQVYELTTTIFEKMKSEGRPGFIHLDYYRFLQHVGPLEDFDAGYRAKPADMNELDPVFLWKRTLIQKGVNPKDLEQVEDVICKQIKQSVESARKAPFANLECLFEDVYDSKTVSIEKLMALSPSLERGHR